MASFINDQGILEHTTWGPKITSVSENTLSARFYNVSANTNYTVRVSAVTRTKKNGGLADMHCTMPPTIPDKQRLSRVTWRKMEEEGRWMFKLLMPRVSERNGPICCYRIYLVRMESQQKLAELPVPSDLSIVSYHEAHRTPKGGAYVAEMFTRYYRDTYLNLFFFKTAFSVLRFMQKYFWATNRCTTHQARLVMNVLV